MADAVPPGAAALFIGPLAGDPEPRRIAGSESRPCAECGADTLFAPATLARSEAQNPASRFVCLQCATEKGLIDGLTISPPTSAQLNELAANGHDPEAWPLRQAWGGKVVKRG